MFVFCSQFLCKWMINFHNRRLWLGSSCVGRSGFHGPDLRWKMDGWKLSCSLIGHSHPILFSDWLSSHGEYMSWWLARVSYSWFYSAISRLPTLGPDTRVPSLSLVSSPWSPAPRPSSTWSPPTRGGGPSQQSSLPRGRQASSSPACLDVSILSSSRSDEGQRWRHIR